MFKLFNKTSLCAQYIIKLVGLE